MKFDELNIDERILRAIEDMGFEETSDLPEGQNRSLSYS